MKRAAGRSRVSFKYLVHVTAGWSETDLAWDVVQGERWRSCTERNAQSPEISEEDVEDVDEGAMSRCISHQRHAASCLVHVGCKWCPPKVKKKRALQTWTLVTTAITISAFRQQE